MEFWPKRLRPLVLVLVPDQDSTFHRPGLSPSSHTLCPSLRWIFLGLLTARDYVILHFRGPFLAPVPPRLPIHIPFPAFSAWILPNTCPVCRIRHTSATTGIHVRDPPRPSRPPTDPFSHRLPVPRAATIKASTSSFCGRASRRGCPARNRRARRPRASGQAAPDRATEGRRS